jgi:hypothetical protein
MGIRAGLLRFFSESVTSSCGSFVCLGNERLRAKNVCPRCPAEPSLPCTNGLNGTGLNLSMVLGFARQSGGTVRITSEQGKGTCVELWLPRGSAPSDVSDMSKRPSASVNE